MPPRAKSTLDYAHTLAFSPVGATISGQMPCIATLAKCIISEVEVGLLIRAAPSNRNRVLLEADYARSSSPS
jgi:hypothetical protein